MRGEASGVLGPAPRLVLAMALHENGRADEPRKTLAEATLAHDGRAIDGRDQDGWIAHVQRREAEAMILPDLPWLLDGGGEYGDAASSTVRLAFSARQVASRANLAPSPFPLRPTALDFHRYIFSLPETPLEENRASTILLKSRASVCRRFQGGRTRTRAVSRPGLQDGLGCASRRPAFSSGEPSVRGSPRWRSGLRPGPRARPDIRGPTGSAPGDRPRGAAPAARGGERQLLERLDRDRESRIGDIASSRSATSSSSSTWASPARDAPTHARGPRGRGRRGGRPHVAPRPARRAGPGPRLRASP